MKKITILAAVLVAALTFGTTSCKKEDNPRCWKITVTATVMGQSASETGYMWGTSADVESQLEAVKKDAEAVGATVTTDKTEASQYTTEADCVAQNIDL